LRGRLITVAALGLLAVGASISPALAGHAKHKPTKHFATTISITTDQQGGTISGKVTSPSPGCANERGIDLYVDGDHAFSEDTTATGKYGIRHRDPDGNTIPLDPGDYQVKAKQLKLSKHKICDPGKSKVSTVPAS
jgi:hypothetical protein